MTEGLVRRIESHLKKMERLASSSAVAYSTCKKCGSILNDFDIGDICSYCINLQTIPLIYRNLKDCFNMRDIVLSQYRKSMFIYGDVRTGKTTLLTFMCRYRWKKGLLAKYINFPDWINREKFNIETFGKAVTKLKEYGGLLCIDDIGAERITPAVKEKLYLIIDYRQTNMLQTMVTSNYSPEVLPEIVGKRIAYRIFSMCERMKLSGTKQI